jgi:hypothetical protein
MERPGSWDEADGPRHLCGRTYVLAHSPAARMYVDGPPHRVLRTKLLQGSGAAAAAMKAACAIGQLSSPRPRRTPAARRRLRPTTWRSSPAVTRAPAGSSGICSVNADRSHTTSWQAYWTLCQRTASGASL